MLRLIVETPTQLAFFCVSIKYAEIHICKIVGKMTIKKEAYGIIE